MIRNETSRKPVIVVGGGPAGAVAALCLRKLGRDVVVFEKENFPRYHIGESLLPGTLSILMRLGVFEKVAGAGFIRKPAATFLWGGNRPPWSFSFSTPKTSPWVFDYGFQVDRTEYDKILLDAVRERGADVREGCEITDVETGGGAEEVRVWWKDASGSGALEGAFLIDASGTRGIVATKRNLRRWDEYFHNIALWSYFEGGKRFKGDLQGNILSVSFKDGWIWAIPLKNDRYSIGVVSGIELKEDIQALGKEAFYHASLNACDTVSEILQDARPCDETHATRDWSYRAETFSIGRTFLCGDAACFIDPLFSQGVHLATYSAMLAASAVDYLYDYPQRRDRVRQWYDVSYRNAYDRYHRFIVAFYAENQEPSSSFWANRKLRGAEDSRFQGVEWFTSMTGQDAQDSDSALGDLGSATLAQLWAHNEKSLSDEFDGKELALRRLRWANELVKNLRQLPAIGWVTDRVDLVTSYKVNPTSFRLEPQTFLGNGRGRVLTKYAVTKKQEKLFKDLIVKPLSYRELTQHLSRLGCPGSPTQFVVGLMEEGFLRGYGNDGNPRPIPLPLRFGGVGAEDDLS